MQKPHHISLNPAVELAWWVEDPAIQFRITGKAYHFPGESGTIASSIKALGLTGEGLEEGTEKYWEDKRKEIWTKGISGHLRGSFGRPTPGKPLSEIESKPEDWPTRYDPKSVSRQSRALIRVSADCGLAG
jgi:pyridoxamine 5'-phosphate oxidase